MTTRTQPIEEHHVHSLRLMAHAEEQLDAGDRIQASEKAWGAAAHQLKVIADKRGWRYETHTDAHRVAERIADELGDPEIKTLFAVANGLHGNFYKDEKPISMLRHEVGEVKRLMVKLRDSVTPIAGRRKRRFDVTTRTQPIEEHHVHSLRLMEHAEDQLDAGDRIQASEKAWGAVAHQLKVVADRRGWQYETHSDAHRVARRLTNELADPEIHTLFRVATALHHNSYSDTTPIESLRLDIEAVKRLMAKLRDAAAQ